jgi:hypothetical protein
MNVISSNFSLILTESAEKRENGGIHYILAISMFILLLICLLVLWFITDIKNKCHDLKETDAKAKLQETDLEMDPL